MNRTPNVWPVIGTGVPFRWNTNWAEAAMTATPRATSTTSATMLTARLRGCTSDGTSAVEDMTVILGNPAPGGEEGSGGLDTWSRAVESGRSRSDTCNRRDGWYPRPDS